ncbi:MAG: hypothetical protein BHW64_02280 [Candidatus Melainabacteria bacterium LEY3_CP_29_8]|nr:MAG: hypothetical protein BHW64_02280 [Candidatus Melainabacteria bacterium LEY3_CP_29_8]
MSKTINFPEFMENEIINEDDIYPKITFRLDKVYLNYYKKLDIVDIRVSEKILRKAIITKDVYELKIGQLDKEILQYAKTYMRDINNLIQLLQKIYKVNVNLNTTIYVVTYKNIN